MDNKGEAGGARVNILIFLFINLGEVVGATLYPIISSNFFYDTSL
jgi:hypothetical protein